jgi:hypothetical protein
MSGKIRLSITGADEDVPRLLTGYSPRACGGEVAFALRPREGQGLLVLQEKKQAAKVWISDPSLLPAAAQADQGAGGGTDAPGTPAGVLSPNEAVGLLKKMKAKAGAKGPASLRGAWRGVLHCDDGAPVVELERKVASYGTLRLRSVAGQGWQASFVRAEKWFAAGKEERSPVAPRLAEAVQRGMVQMTGLVSEACSFRDTRRRNAVDATYAAEHPYQEPAPPKDATERYNPRDSFRVVEAASGFDVVNLAGVVVARFGGREKGKASQHAAALNRGQGARAEAPAGFPEPLIQPDPRAKETSPSRVPPALSSIPSPAAPACPVSVQRIAEAAQKEADALTSLSDSLWGSTEAPELLRRAGKLIRHAEALVASPLCTGREKEQARAELDRAAAAYTEARAALQRGDDPDTVTTLKRVAERVSLAAARAAKSCAGSGKSAKAATPSLPPKAAPAPKPAPAEARAPRGRKPRAQAAPEVDPAKDALLVDAFAQAIKAAAAEMQGGAA